MCIRDRDKGVPHCAAPFGCKNIDTRFVMDKHPNIILLMADQMRGDCLGIAGHPDVKTPFLDACLLYTS